MKSKIFTIVIGLLALYVILHLIVIRKGNVLRVERQSRVIERQLQQNDKEKKKLMGEKLKMEKVLASIPTTILEGFADPENQFVDFMDYIENSDLKKMKET